MKLHQETLRHRGEKKCKVHKDWTSGRRFILIKRLVDFKKMPPGRGRDPKKSVRKTGFNTIASLEYDNSSTGEASACRVEAGLHPAVSHWANAEREATSRMLLHIKLKKPKQNVIKCWNVKAPLQIDVECLCTKRAFCKQALKFTRSSPLLFIEHTLTHTPILADTTQ